MFNTTNNRISPTSSLATFICLQPSQGTSPNSILISPFPPPSELSRDRYKSVSHPKFLIYLSHRIDEDSAGSTGQEIQYLLHTKPQI